MFVPLYDDNPYDETVLSVRHARARRHQRARLRVHPVADLSRRSGRDRHRLRGNPAAVTLHERLDRRRDSDRGHLPHLHVLARRMDASDRQHAVPLDLRGQCRARDGAAALSAFLSRLRHRRRARALLVDAGLDGTAGRRLGRDCRHRRRLPHAVSSRQGMGAAVRAHSRYGCARAGCSAPGSRSSSSICSSAPMSRPLGGLISAASRPGRSSSCFSVGPTFRCSRGTCARSPTCVDLIRVGS